MKRILNFALAMLIFAITLSSVACGDKNDDGAGPGKDIVAPVVDLDSLYFSAKGDVRTVKVTSDAEWLPEPSDDWIEVVKTDEQTLTVTVDASTAAEKTGTITIDNGSEEPVVISVTQKEIELVFIQAGYIKVNDICMFNLYFYDVIPGTTADNWEESGYGVNLQFASEEPAPGRYPNIATGTYTFKTTGDDPFTGFVANADLGESYSFAEKVPHNGNPEYFVYIKAGSTFTVAMDGDEYVIRMQLALSDNTEFVAVYRGIVEAVDPTIGSNLYEDVEPNLVDGKGNVEFMGDWQLNGTYHFNVKIMDPRITYTPASFPNTDTYSGEGNLFWLEFITEQVGDGTVIPEGTYTLKPVYQSDQMAGINTAGTVLSGWPSPMGRAGSWFFEVQDILFIKAAPLLSGEVTVSYAEGVYTFTYDVKDDADNRISGSASGTLDYSIGY